MSPETGAELDAVEEVDGVIVAPEVRALPQRRSAREAAVAGTALAATGFVAGAAAAIVVAQRRSRRAAAQTAPRRAKAPSAPSGPAALGIEATRSFLVDVHVLTRRP